MRKESATGKELTTRLREAKLRVTPQRLAVLRALASGPHVASCHAIWERTRRRGLGLVTVYRVLERLKGAGLVEEIDIRGTAHFEFAGRHHDHAICQRCGAIEPTDICLMTPLKNRRLTATGFLVEDHRLDLLGLCRSCQSAV